MATLTEKPKQVAAGAFFVEDTCIDCDLCRQTAPAFFSRKTNGITGISVVHKQPSTPSEVALCVEALRACPVEAIGRS